MAICCLGWVEERTCLLSCCNYARANPQLLNINVQFLTLAAGKRGTGSTKVCLLSCSNYFSLPVCLAHANQVHHVSTLVDSVAAFNLIHHPGNKDHVCG